MIWSASDRRGWESLSKSLNSKNKPKSRTAKKLQTIEKATQTIEKITQAQGEFLFQFLFPSETEFFNRERKLCTWRIGWVNFYNKNVINRTDVNHKPFEGIRSIQSGHFFSRIFFVYLTECENLRQKQIKRKTMEQELNLS